MGIGPTKENWMVKNARIIIEKIEPSYDVSPQPAVLNIYFLITIFLFFRARRCIQFNKV
jgi:hypothetical protein